MDKKNRLQVERDKDFSYSIYLEKDFSRLTEALSQCRQTDGKVCVVTDTHVGPLYCQAVKDELEKVFSKVTCFVMEAGEAHKQLSTVQDLYAHLIHNNFERRDLLRALGGGVIGDLTGFAAATYLRGIDFVQVPTTLLAQVDSSIGGKTGVDFESYKNMVGAFHQPKLVYMNLNTLNTLDKEQFACGMAEILKHGLLKDEAYYQWLEEHHMSILDRELSTLQEMIFRSCQIKGDIVKQDPHEKGLRALLNLGHTIGHAIERKMDFHMLHGQCVALGYTAAAFLSQRRGLIEKDVLDKIEKINGLFHLPVQIKADLSTEDLLETTKKDKKMSQGRVRFILLRKIGEAFADHTVSEDELRAAIDYLKGVS